MLRRSGVRALDAGDRAAARALCDLDPVTNVFVAARLDEGALGSTSAAFGLDGDVGQPLAAGADSSGFDADGLGRGGARSLESSQRPLRSMLWASANLVPVEASPDDLERYAARVKCARRRVSSLFGPAEQVLPLWQLVSRSYAPARSFRPEQPLMVASREARERQGIEPEPRVRVARLDEVDAIVPAAAAMFTEEIGYAPYVGSAAAYRAGVQRLVMGGRTFVLMDGARVRFKADVGSLASGVAQIQGVWIDPAWRGRGLAAPCMARVVDLVEAELAPTVSLYVNGYNTPALRAYERAGFERVGTFATVIL